MNGRPHASRDDAIDLTLGQPLAVLPRAVQAAVLQSMHGRPQAYLPPGGLPALRRAVAEEVASRDGRAVEPEQVVFAAGATHALFAVLRVLCEPGDIVAVPDPGYPHYRLLADVLGLRLVYYPLSPQEDYRPDLSGLRHLDRAPRALIWNFPHNPVGHLASREWVQEAVAYCHDVGAWLLSDEVYGDLIYEGRHVSPAAVAGTDRLFAFYSFSKGHGLAGWRLGYVVAPRELAAEVERVVWATTMGAPSVTQVAALAILSGSGGERRSHLQALRANRDLAVERLRAMGLRVHVPAAGCFLWVGVGHLGLDGDAVARRWAQEWRVYVSPGSQFGPASGGYVRLSFAVQRERLVEALDRLDNWAAAGFPG